MVATPQSLRRVVLEGNFTTYTEIWQVGAVGASAEMHIAIDRLSESVHVFDMISDDYFVLDLTDGSDKITTTEIAASLNPNARNMDVSIFRKYAVICGPLATQIRIIKDGAVLQTLTEALASFIGIGISPNGEFIVAYDTTDNELFGFQGV